MKNQKHMVEMTSQGPISSTLEEELKRELRRQGIVVWLDRNNEYGSYVDTLITRNEQHAFPYPVIAFRGSYLEMILALEHFGDGLDKESLLIHMPGHTETTIRKTPILEWYEAGSRYRRSLETLIKETAIGNVTSDRIDLFLSREGVTLERAELWLQQETAQTRQGLAGYLENLSLEWILDGLLGETQSLREKVSESGSLNILLDHLCRHTGMNTDFLAFFNKNTTPTFTNITETFSAWILCVEYVNDLTREPHIPQLKPVRQLPKRQKENCLKLVDYFRTRHPQEYISYAMITESRIQDEIDAIAPEDLGHIDTFKHEEERILQGTVQALRSREWIKALQWTQERTEATSFWLQRDPARRMVWKLTAEAAAFGSLLDKAHRPLQEKSTLQEAIEFYTTKGYAVDKAHRKFEQHRLKLLDSKLPHFSQLLEIADNLRHLYRQWADALAEDFTAICEKDGFLPDKAFQQRFLYDQVVHPVSQGTERVAYFIIDALRYEMATDLVPEFEDTRTSVILKGMFCELPSITSIGKNVLAPVQQSGRLTLAGGKGFNGFKTGEYTVRAHEDRIRAMCDRSMDNISRGRKKTRGISLMDVCNGSIDSLKRSLAGVDLIVIHSQEIDDAGEANVGLASFETWISQIKAAWNHLRSIGIHEFVITSDHGFLLQDNTTKHIRYGSKRDPKRRYIYSEDARAEQGMTSVSLRSLNYDGKEGFLLFRRDTAVFDTGKSDATFGHGGNSLQERVIPVLTVSHKISPSFVDITYRIVAEAQPEILGLSRLKLYVKQTSSSSQLNLDFISAQSINLALRVPNRPDITVNLKDADGAEISNQNLIKPICDEAAEVLCDLTGPRDEKVRLEIYNPDGSEKVEPCIIDAYFKVSGAMGSDLSQKTAEDRSWETRFDDKSVCNVFLHLAKHGSVTEQELNAMLETPRNVRRFAMKFEEYVACVPFSVKIEIGANGKRYVKEG